MEPTTETEAEKIVHLFIHSLTQSLTHSLTYSHQKHVLLEHTKPNGEPFLKWSSSHVQ